ncbi:MAG: RluA family pseudouridine synthase [Clostridia bacterium]|nr:RluA family pseudouridine synthase [Clostridia bacterium]
MSLNIIYEDEAFLVINKPAFMPIHPTAYHLNDTLANGVRYYFDSIDLRKKIRPVNRLDRNTSGLVLFAKNEYIQEHLIRQMCDGSFIKKYLGIVNGSLSDLLDNDYVSNLCLESKSIVSCTNSSGIIEGYISAPISRKDGSIIERIVESNGIPSITSFKLIKDLSNYSLVEFFLKTGRTHQIRVHMSFIAHPLLGDSLYGTSSSLINRQALHSYYLSFMHPITASIIEFKSSIPEDMKKVIYF